MLQNLMPTALDVGINVVKCWSSWNIDKIFESIFLIFSIQYWTFSIIQQDNVLEVSSSLNTKIHFKSQKKTSC